MHLQMGQTHLITVICTRSILGSKKKCNLKLTKQSHYSRVLEPVCLFVPSNFVLVFLKKKKKLNPINFVNLIIGQGVTNPLAYLNVHGWDQAAKRDNNSKTGRSLILLSLKVRAGQIKSSKVSIML